MPVSRSNPKRKPQPSPRRWTWRRLLADGRSFFAIFALLFFGAPFVEPLLSGAPLDLARAMPGLTVGSALLTGSTILDHERRDR
jgi:hypothetical protein